MRDRPWEAGSLPTPLIPVERTFEGFLELEWVELSAESAHVRFQVRENLKQPLGLLHGGIYCAVAESVASVATVNAVWRNGMIGSGLNNSASFVRPVTGGAVDASQASAITTIASGSGATSSGTKRGGSARLWT